MNTKHNEELSNYLRDRDFFGTLFSLANLSTNEPRLSSISKSLLEEMVEARSQNESYPRDNNTERNEFLRQRDQPLGHGNSSPSSDRIHGLRE